MQAPQMIRGALEVGAPVASFVDHGERLVEGRPPLRLKDLKTRDN